MNLTKSTIESLHPPSTGKYLLHWDSALPGFGVRVTASGAKAFVVQRRVGGHQRRVTIGRCGVLTVQEARQRARKLMVDMGDGIDPAREKLREKRSSVTLRTAIEAYQSARSLKPSTLKDQERAFSWAFSDWLDAPLRERTREDISKRHKALGKRSPARANLAMRYLRAVFTFARAEYRDGEEPLFLENPVRKLSETRSWFKVDRRRTVIRPHQLPAWFAAVEHLENHCARDFFLFVLFTGLRRSEALNLEWKNVDLPGRSVTILETKNSVPHCLPLPDYLLGILKARQKESVGPYVFSSDRGRLQNLRTMQSTIQAQSGVRFCVHDLRRTFATIANSIGIPAYAVKALLNHKSSDVTAGYIITDVEGLRAPMEQISAYILNAVGLAHGICTKGGRSETHPVLPQEAALPS